MAVLSWEQKAQVKRTQAAAKIPPAWRLPSTFLANISQVSSHSVLDIPRTCGLLNDRELQITESFDATDLLSKLAARKYSSLEVTTAFAKRAAIAQQLTSCLTETFFEQALARAKQLDEYLEKTGTVIGPLHGLPVSIKDSFSLEGIPTTIGFVDFLDHLPKTYNSALVEVLLGAGAVLYVKTNVPQTMMTADSHNNVFGRTLNPYHLNLTAGGSSGGEGALVALRGSLLGVGTDIAGSVRIPSLCCGTVGFKPSVDRIPYGGQTSAGRPGAVGIAACAGPLCHSVRDAELFSKVVFNSNAANFDERALGVPWIEPEEKNILTIGIMPEDALFPLHPQMQRCLKMAAQKLEAAGHNLVDLSLEGFPSWSAALDLSFSFFNMDPDHTFVSHIKRSGEPPIPSLKFSFDLGKPEVQLRDLYEMNIAQRKLAVGMHQLFVKNQLDLIIGPGYQSCAVPHDTFGMPAYTVLWNLLNYPSCVLPFGKADAAMDAAFIRNVPYNPEYNPDAVEGAPCHIQLVTRTMKDEELLRNAAAVEKALKNDGSTSRRN